MDPALDAQPKADSHPDNDPSVEHVTTTQMTATETVAQFFTKWGGGVVYGLSEGVIPP